MIELNKSDKAYTCIDNIVPIIQFNKSDKIILITYLDWTDKLGRLEDFQSECESGSIFDTELVRKCFVKVNDSLGTADKVFLIVKKFSTMLQSKNIVLKVLKDITGYHYIYTIILIIYLIKIIKKRNIIIMSLKLMEIVNSQ